MDTISTSHMNPHPSSVHLAYVLVYTPFSTSLCISSCGSQGAVVVSSWAMLWRTVQVQLLTAALGNTTAGVLIIAPHLIHLLSLLLCDIRGFTKTPKICLEAEKSWEMLEFPGDFYFLFNQIKNTNQTSHCNSWSTTRTSELQLQMDTIQSMAACLLFTDTHWQLAMLPNCSES